MYYVTIRTKEGECHFGEIVDGTMILSSVGIIAQECWERIPEHFVNVSLGIFQMMPNHIHGIAEIVESSASEDSPASSRKDLINQVHTNEVPSKGGSGTWPLMKNPKQTLGKIVRSFKAEATKKIHDAGLVDFGWHGRFYDHIVRDGKDLDRIRRYILDNPVNWHNDENFPGNIRMDEVHKQKEDWSPLD
jgi:putative transposase